MVPVRLSDPAAELAVVLLTKAVTESVNDMATEMVLFPVPAPIVVMVAPAPPLSKIRGPPVPVEIVLVNVDRSVLNTIDPTVLVPSRVMLRLAVWTAFDAV